MFITVFSEVNYVHVHVEKWVAANKIIMHQCP